MVDAIMTKELKDHLCLFFSLSFALMEFVETMQQESKSRKEIKQQESKSRKEIKQ